MIIYNILKNGSEYQLLDKNAPVPEGWSVEAETVNERYIEDYITSPIAVPNSVTMRQARLALLQVGKIELVPQIINSLPSPYKEAAMIEWEYSSEVYRHNGFVSQIGPALGMSPAEIDNLFILAKDL
jgi:uncharacterized protein YbdZ (MbtH family)